MCSMPRKPQRKPKPSAAEDSTARNAVPRRSAATSAAPRETPRTGRSCTGNRPANTRGLTGRNPASGSSPGWRSSRDRVADRRAVDVLDARDQIAHLAGPQGIAAFLHLRREDADVRHDDDDSPVDITRIFCTGMQLAVDDANQRHNADVVVEPGVDDQRLQRTRPGSPSGAGMRSTIASSSSSMPSPVLGADQDGVIGMSRPMISSISVADPLRLGGRQIDLVDDRERSPAPGRRPCSSSQRSAPRRSGPHPRPAAHPRRPRAIARPRKRNPRAPACR